MLPKNAWIMILIIASSTAICNTDEHFFADKAFTNLHISVNEELEAESTSSTYRLDRLTADLSFFPQDNFMQSISNLTPDPPAEIKDDTLHFEWNNPPLGTFRFGYEADVSVTHKIQKIKKKIGFPIKEELPDETKAYLLPTPNIDSKDPEIIDIASELASGEDDLYVVVDKLASWTKDNIEYNLGTLTASISQSASWTLKNKQGVCDELTALFIAMSRSLGIPARFISGIAYTNSELFDQEWGAHGWAEVYFPETGWVPFDTTYGQRGFVDPSHVVMKVSDDPEHATTEFSWTSRDVKMSVTGNIETGVDLISEGRQLSDFISIKADVIEEDVGFGSYQIVEASIENLKDYYVSTDLAIFLPTEIEVLNGKDRHITLAPKERRTEYFMLKVGSDLRTNMIYTFPIKLLTTRNESASISFMASSSYPVIRHEQVQMIIEQKEAEESKEYSSDVTLSCTPDHDIIYAGEEAHLICILKNTGNTVLKDARLCLEDECAYFNISINQQAEHSFRLRNISSGKIISNVIASNDQFSKTATVVLDILDIPVIQITGLSGYAGLGYDEAFTLNFTIVKRSASNPDNVKVRLTIGEAESLWDIPEMSANQEFIIDMNSNMLEYGQNEAKVIVEYEDKINRSYSITASTALSMTDLTFYERSLVWLGSIARKLAALIS